MYKSQGLARSQAVGERLLALRLLLWPQEPEGIRPPGVRAVVSRALHDRPPSPDADYTFLAPIVVGRALDAVRTRDPRALAEALGEPTTSSLAAARIVGTYQHPGDPRPCGADSLVCAWVESALQDPQVAARPWRETFVTQLAAFRHVSLEPLRLYSKDPWRGPFLLGVPSHTGGAFVLAVIEALQRSLAAGR